MIEELGSHEIRNILETTGGQDPLPRYNDEDRWQQIQSNPMLAESIRRWRELAHGALKEELTQVPASLYLSYQRTGSRAPHDGTVAGRRNRLTAFVVGECLERRGRFLDPIMDHAWAICEESSWVIPAHGRKTLPEYTDISWVDLVSAGTALTFSESLYMIGERLDQHDPMIGERMIQEIERRCWIPYLDHDNPWMFAEGEKRVNNWNAVCNCGVVGSAILMMQDDRRLALMIEKCLRSLNDYLRSFDSDGGSDEGPSYWVYGVSNYVWLSYLLETRTEGRLSLLDAPEMQQIAMFPQQVTLTGRYVANFSDCGPQVFFTPSLMFYLGRRLDLPGVSAFAQREFDLDGKWGGRYGVRDFTWMPSKPDRGKWEPEDHVYLKGQEWMISRFDSGEGGLVLAAKGGNNGENHNQNDLGNFMVCYAGEPLIVDLGSGTYTKDYFGEGRYDILVNTSWGHNLPLVNGRQQPVGPEYRAKVMEHAHTDEEDLLLTELKGAYPPEAGLESLVRRVSLNRKAHPGFVEVDDMVRLAGPAGTCKTPIYTYGDVALGKDGGFRITGKDGSIEVRYRPTDLDPVTEEVEINDGKVRAPLRRVVFDLPVRKGAAHMNLRIVPLVE
jgi:hypothetical protein